MPSYNASWGSTSPPPDGGASPATGPFQGLSGAQGAPTAPPSDPTGRRTEGAEGGSSGLPCQNSHNSTGPAHGRPSSGRRTAHALSVNVQAFVDRFGVNRCGFLTLTFREHVLDPREAQRRFNSLATHVLRRRYRAFIRILERQKSGRIHYHLLVAMADDIRTGCDFDAFARRDYRSAPPELRGEWAFWRRTAPGFGFGRTELLPVKSGAEAVGRYLGKYIGKHLEARLDADRGIRLVAYSGVQSRTATTRFAWASSGARQWRLKLRAFVHMLYDSGAIGSPTLSAVRVRFGPRWARYWRDNIVSFPLEDGL
jgi:hypothetical protein